MIIDTHLLELSRIAPPAPGHHDVTWISREPGQPFCAEGVVSDYMREFLVAMDRMAASRQSDLDGYEVGTAFINVVPANGVSSGTFHYDTGFDRPLRDSNVGAPVWRFAASYATDGTEVGYVFSSNHAHYGELVGPLRQNCDPALTQPSNGRVVMYEEGTGLHGVAPGKPRPGAVTMIFSAALYQRFQVPTLIPALTSLKRPDVYMWRQCGEGS